MFKRIIKQFFSSDWKYFAQLGIDYVKENLLPKLALPNAFFYQLGRLVLTMFGQAIPVMTDSDPDNARQIKGIVSDNLVEIASLTATAAITELKDDTAKRKVIAAFESACAKLKAELRTDKTGLLGPAATKAPPVS